MKQNNLGKPANKNANQTTKEVIQAHKIPVASSFEQQISTTMRSTEASLDYWQKKIHRD